MDIQAIEDCNNLKEMLVDVGWTTMQLFPLMEILGHRTLKGHLCYRHEKTPLTLLLKYLSNPSEKTRKELIENVYGGDEGLEEWKRAAMMARKKSRKMGKDD